uniref:Uncharacterized protein n=1 Tax=Strongyloides venezuelensis TaxID=75913 RepID=A0A0K0G039_STRVS
MKISFGGECFCIHAISQIIDIFVQCYIFGKGFVSEPVGKILIDGNEKEYPKFLELYLKFQKMLVSIFKSKNIGIIRNFYLIIGTNVYKPEEVIKIPLNCCSLHSGVEGKCSDENCGPFNDKNQRYLYREFVRQFDILCNDKIKKSSKIFVYIDTEEELKTFSNDIEESDELECLESDGVCKVSEFMFENSCNGEAKECGILKNPVYYRWQEYFSFEG